MKSLSVWSGFLWEHDDRVTFEEQWHLVEGAKSGSLDCFGRLYELYYKDMVAIVYAAAGDRHLAEDAAQETFATACG
jgi:hypothetical protein